MKIKRILSCAAAAALLLGTQVFAAGADNAAVFDVTQISGSGIRKISVKVNALDGSSLNETLYVIKDGDADPVADGKISYAEVQNAVYAGESTSSEFSFNLPVGVAEKGVYTIVAGGYTQSPELKYRYLKFYYDGNAEADTVYLNDLNNGVTAEKLAAGNNKEYYIDTNNRAYTNNASAVAAIVNDLKGSGFKNQFELESTFKTACDFVDSENSSAAMLKTYIKYNNDKLGFDTSNADYAENPDNTVSILKSILDTKKGTSEVISLADLKKAFREACAVSCIDKTTDYTKSLDNLKKYNDVFELDFITKLQYIDPLEVAKVFTDTRYLSVDAVKKDYNDRVDSLYADYLANNNNNGGGNSGGFGGSGGGGSTYVPGGSIVDTDKMNELTGNTSRFSDVANGHWAKDYIEFVCDNKIMTGDGNGEFRPDAEISREEWTKTALSAFAIDTNGAESGFSDVLSDRWSYPFVSKAFEMTVVNGVSEDSFDPEASISRQDAVVMLYRLVKMTREDFDYGRDTAQFSDNGLISDYARDAVDKMTAIKVIGGYGDGTFAPQKTLTRAEAAKIIKTLLDAVG